MLGKTADEVIEDIINHEKEYSGIDWRKAAEGTKEDKAEALEKAHELLKKLREQFSEEEVNTAKAMNLLDANGELQDLTTLLLFFACFLFLSDIICLFIKT